MICFHHPPGQIYVYKATQSDLIVASLDFCGFVKFTDVAFTCKLLDEGHLLNFINSRLHQETK